MNYLEKLREFLEHFLSICGYPEIAFVRYDGDIVRVALANSYCGKEAVFREIRVNDLINLMRLHHLELDKIAKIDSDTKIFVFKRW